MKCRVIAEGFDGQRLRKEGEIVDYPFPGMSADAAVPSWLEPVAAPKKRVRKARKEPDETESEETESEETEPEEESGGDALLN